MSILIKHLDHKNVLKNSNMQLDIVDVATSLARETKVQLSVAITEGNCGTENVLKYVKQVFTSCDDLLRKKQFYYILARHGSNFELNDEMVADDKEREACQDIINNVKLNEGYLTLARDIEVMEAKTPKNIYKAHLLDGQASVGASADSARENLATTFVNAFVNAGFGHDKLMIVPSDASSGGASGNWLFKNKEHGKTSAAASLIMEDMKERWETTDSPIVHKIQEYYGVVNFQEIDEVCNKIAGYVLKNLRL